MGIKRLALETLVSAMRAVYRYRKPKDPLSILVLRNNDLGDLVVVTPLFQALRAAFPDAYIVAAVGSWALDILKNNPYVSEVVTCDAPWHNHRVGGRSLTRALSYIFRSPEVARLKAYKFDVGIDVLGSPFGSMLLMRLNIPIRLGRKGYAGGHTGSTKYIHATTNESVGRNAVQFVRLLKSDARDFDSKPQLFVDAAEVEEAEMTWQAIQGRGDIGKPRVVVAPGAGIPDKRWPVEKFAELVSGISKNTNGYVLGSGADFKLGETIAAGVAGWSNKCGKLSIRQSMALISKADLVICPPSFVMHVAAAFSKPCVLILPKQFEPESHATLWEVRGIHHALSARAEDPEVRVDDVERQTNRLLESILGLKQGRG